MAEQKWMTKTVFFPALVLALFIVGRMIPPFYDWTGANQSYSTPALDHAIWSLISFGCLAWFVIPWLPMKEAPAKEVPTKSEPRRFQFNLYSLMVLTAIVAVLFAMIANQSVVTCVLFWVVAFVAAVRMVVKNLCWKWQFSALLACMYFPYSWLIASGEFKNIKIELVLGAVGLPSFVPSVCLARMFFETHPLEIVWLWILLTAIEVAIGFWLIRIAPKCTIAYFVLVMLLSIYGSLFLNLGTRI